MRIPTTVLFLSASLAIISCKKKADRDETPAGTGSGLVRKAEPVTDARTGPTGVPVATPEAVPLPTTEGFGEAASDDAVVETPEMVIKNGETYVLGQGRETVVMNVKPVDDGLRRFRQGATCRVDPEGKAKIIGKRIVKEEGEEYEEYLVRYTRDPSAEALQLGATADADAVPYECPNGTVFFLDEPDILEEDEPDPRFAEARKLLNSEKP
jgi:hypothetical protein